MARKRKSISNNDRWFIYNRDDFKCVCCGEDDISKLEIDHIVPFSKGGEDSIFNYQTLCHRCNSVKSDDLYGEIFHREKLKDCKGLYDLLIKEFGIFDKDIFNV